MTRIARTVPDLMATTLARTADRTRQGERISTVVALGADLTVAVAAHYTDRGEYVEATVTAFDSDGNVLATLARTSGPLDDATLTAAYAAAARLFPTHL